MFDDPNLPNWARLDEVGLEAIVDYVEEAEKNFPKEGMILKDDNWENLLVNYAHLLLCTKLLMLHCYPKYWDRIESDRWMRLLQIKNDGDSL